MAVGFGLGVEGDRCQQGAGKLEQCDVNALPGGGFTVAQDGNEQGRHHEVLAEGYIGAVIIVQGIAHQQNKDKGYAEGKQKLEVKGDVDAHFTHRGAEAQVLQQQQEIER